MRQFQSVEDYHINPSNRFSFRHLSTGTFYECPSPTPWGQDDRAVRRTRALRPGTQLSPDRWVSGVDPFDVAYSGCRTSARWDCPLLLSVADCSGLNPGSWWRSRGCPEPWTLKHQQQSLRYCSRNLEISVAPKETASNDYYLQKLDNSIDR